MTTLPLPLKYDHPIFRDAPNDNSHELNRENRRNLDIFQNLVAQMRRGGIVARTMISGTGENYFKRRHTLVLRVPTFVSFFYNRQFSDR